MNKTKEDVNLMSVQDIPYVVNNMDSINLLIDDILEEFFYDLKGKEYAAYNFNRIKANIEAIRALHIVSLNVLVKIAENTEGVELDD